MDNTKSEDSSSSDKGTILHQPREVEPRPEIPDCETLAIRRFLLFEKKVQRILKDLSGCFKLLQVEMNHLDRNDFLASQLQPVMGEVSSTIHQMEQFCVNQNPGFVPAKDPGPRENTLNETQEKADQKAIDEYFNPKPQASVPVRKSKRKTDQIILEKTKEAIPSPQPRNLPPEFFDLSDVQFYSKETDASKPENRMSPKMKRCLAELHRVYDEKDERDRKAAEAKAQAQSNTESETQPPINGTPSNN